MPFEFPPELASTIPAEHLNHTVIQRYNSPAELIKGHIDAQEYRGRSVALPNGESKPEDMEKWRGEQNVKLKDRGFAITPLGELPPESPDKYEFNFGDKVKPEEIASDEMLKGYRSVAHEFGLNGKQAEGIVKYFAEKVAPEIAKKYAPPEVDFVYGEKVNELMNGVFKDKTTQTLDEYKKNVDTLAMTIPELKDALNAGIAPIGEKWAMLGDHPAIVKLVNTIAELTRSDFAGNVSGGVRLNQDAAQLKQEADDIMGNPENPKYKKYWASDKETVEYVNSLYEKAHPGERNI